MNTDNDLLWADIRDVTHSAGSRRSTSTRAWGWFWTGFLSGSAFATALLAALM